MSYEIPAELEYKEIIMFGLTFMQLLYAMVFLVPIAIILKSGIDYTIQAVIIALLVGIALMFMFFNLTEKLKEMWQYMKLKTKYQRYLETDQKVAVLKIKPINFTIKTDEEKQVIIKTFRKFLNSLNFPIQILIKTEPLLLDNYLNQLHKKSLNKELVAGMKKHLSETLSDKVLNKTFYIIIPEKTGLEKRQCIEKLKDLNLKVDEAKLPAEKYYKIDITSADFKIKQYHTIIAVRGYPRFVESGFLDKVVTSQGYFDISIHIEPDSIEHTMVTLNKELQKQKADLYSAELKGVVSPSLEIKYKDTKSILEQLHKGEEKLFNVSVYVECRASTREELRDLVAKIQSELNALMMDSKIPTYRMIQGLKSVLPSGIDALNIKRNITSNALSAFFPFTSPFLEIDDDGIWLGLNKNNIPVIKDVFKQFNPNGCILASSGSGKSYTAKLIISRYILNGTKVIVIDPQCEYKQLVKHFNGQCVEISRTSETVINPLDLVGHEYPDKRLSLMGLIPVMLGELTESQKSLMDKAITMAYQKKGISIDEATWSNMCPMMSDVLDALKTMERGANTFEKVSIKSLMNRVEMYVNGVFCFLNKQTKLDFNNNFVCFDISKMPKLVQPVMMYLILDYVYMKMKADINRKLLVIDEAWTLLGRAEDSNYIFEIVKTCRKFNMGLLLINQEVEGLLTSKAGKSVLANTSYTFLMKQKPAVIKDIRDTFNLSPAEKDYLLTASIGEGLLIIGDEHTELKVVASAEEHKLITTNADELLKLEANAMNPAFRKDVEIKLDLSSDVYRKADLSEDDVKYLVRNGYAEEQCRAIEAKRQEAYLVKKKRCESMPHVFLVWEIANYLKKYTSEIKTTSTSVADIIVQTPKGEFAIEIETGYFLKHNKAELFDKVKALNEKFGSNWCFVVTDNDIRKQYRRLGRTYTRMDLSRLVQEIPLSPPQILAFKALSPSNSANSPAGLTIHTTNTEVSKMNDQQPKNDKNEPTKEYNDQPILETRISLSKDGKYVIHKTIITDIKPIAYMQKVLGSE